MGDFPDGTPKPDQASSSGESNRPIAPSPRPAQLQWPPAEPEWQPAKPQWQPAQPQTPWQPQGPWQSWPPAPAGPVAGTSQTVAPNTAGPTVAPGQGLPLDGVRWRPTALVAAVIAVVVVGGLVLNGILPAPSAGTQDIGGGVTITAASGWVLTSAPGDNSAGIVLQKGDATLTAQVLSRSYSGSSGSVMAQVRQQLESQVTQISYGDEHQTLIAGNDSTSVLFEAILSGSERSSSHMGTVDGELVCMVVSDNAVVVEVAAPQGDLQYVTDDISAMVKTVRAA